jgi:uncharacterized protein YciI
MKLALLLPSIVVVALAASVWSPLGGAQGEPAMKSTFLVLYRPGPAWAPGKHIREQPPKEHGKYLLGLYERGTMKFAGPFDDDTGAAIVLEAADAAEAQALIDGDPAIKARIFTREIHPWAPVAWEKYVKKK